MGKSTKSDGKAVAGAGAGAGKSVGVGVGASKNKIGKSVGLKKKTAKTDHDQELAE